VSEDAETRAADSAERVFAALPNEVVFAVPEEDEVSAIDPLEECADLLDLAAIERGAANSNPATISCIRWRIIGQSSTAA